MKTIWVFSSLAVISLVGLCADAQVAYVAQSREVSASALDTPTVRRSAPGFGPFVETVTATNQFNSNWASASQNSTLGAFEISAVCTTAGGRCCTVAPYPSSTSAFSVTFDVAGASVLRMRSTYNYASWSLTGPSFSLTGLGFGQGRFDRGVLLPGRYVFQGTTSLEHLAGTVVPTDMTLRLGVAACAADLDDGTGTGVSDGGVDIADLVYFLDQYSRGGREADLDDGTGSGHADGGVGVEDLLYFLIRYVAGC